MYKVRIDKYYVGDAKSEKYTAKFDWWSKITFDVAIDDYWLKHIIATILYMFQHIAHDANYDIREYPHS
jgi:hypothetical protein